MDRCTAHNVLCATVQQRTAWTDVGSVGVVRRLDLRESVAFSQISSHGQLAPLSYGFIRERRGMRRIRGGFGSIARYRRIDAGCARWWVGVAVGVAPRGVCLAAVRCVCRVPRVCMLPVPRGPHGHAPVPGPSLAGSAAVARPRRDGHRRGHAHGPGTARPGAGPRRTRAHPQPHATAGGRSGVSGGPRPLGSVVTRVRSTSSPVSAVRTPAGFAFRRPLAIHRTCLFQR